MHRHTQTNKHTTFVCLIMIHETLTAVFWVFDDQCFCTCVVGHVCVLTPTTTRHTTPKHLTTYELRRVQCVVHGLATTTWERTYDDDTWRNERWTTGSEKRASPSSLSVILTSVVHYRGGTTPYKYIYSCECALLPLLPICLCGRAGDRGTDYKNEETLSMTWSSKISRRTFLEISSSTSF